MAAVLPPGCVLLTPRDVRVVAEALSLMCRVRLRQGRPIPAALVELRRVMADSGQADMRTDIVGGPIDNDEPMTVNQVAEILGQSPRQVRRIASGLGGVKAGRQWLINASAIQEHIEGRAS